MDIDDLLGRMVTAGRGLATDVWAKAGNFAIPELKKIAVQIEAIVEHHADYTPEGAKDLLAMQVKAAIGMIVAMTSLVMKAVQDMINAILAAVRDFVNGAIGFALI